MGTAASIWSIMDSGWGIAAILAVALVGVYLRYVRDKAKTLEQTLIDARATMADVDGKLDTHCAKCLGYHEELRGVLSTDRWKTVAEDLRDISQDINRFVNEGRESREVTQSVVNGIAHKLDSLTMEVISTLRAGLGLSHGPKDE